MDYPLRIKGQQYETAIVATTAVNGGGGYDTAAAEWQFKLISDLRIFLGKVPSERGYLWIDVRWSKADPPPEPPCRTCPEDD